MRDDVKTEFNSTLQEINFRLVRIEEALKTNHEKEMIRIDELFNKTVDKTGVFAFMFALNPLREYATVTLPQRYLELARAIGSEMHHIQTELKDMNETICSKSEKK